MLAATQTGVMTQVPVLVLNPFARCNCRCKMCDIWTVTEGRAMELADVERHVDELLPMGLTWVTLSGGEPLMHPRIFDICQSLRVRGLRVTLLSSGLLVERHAARLASLVDELILSVDGPPAVHDAIRGVHHAFSLLARGVGALRAHRANIAIHARTTIQRANHSALRPTIEATRALAIDSISFLAADLTSPAFARTEPWPVQRRAAVALEPGEVETLDREIELIISSGDCGGFVRESPAKLRRIVDHFRADLGLMSAKAPLCNAPWISAVMEHDGTVRPCFFQPPLGRVTEGASLVQLLNSPGAVAFRAGLDVARNPVCQRCVCSLHWKGD